ncbi:BEL1-like homeodomain protein 4 [Triticum urartu]|uniref:Homeobox domain-containing protein n=1 Tax=Triticum urartu TaxID=4572 RepID=A0A8R7JZX1_TRIUA|nr:BEL1-like homeodomain protein 4 [Triticum urartu]
MAHDPSLVGYADYFAETGSNGGGVTLVPEVDTRAEHQMYGGGLHHHHHSGVDMFGARGFGMAPPGEATSAQSKAALDVDVDGSSTISFFRGEQHHHQHQQLQMGQAPLSLSLHGPPDAGSSSFMLHHQLGGGEPRLQQHQQTAPGAWQVQGAGSGWQLRGSRFLLPTQQLLQEFCSIPADTDNKAPKKPAQEEHGSSSSASWPPSSTQIQSMDAAELQRLKAKLYTMIEEVDRRYRRYRDQMRAVAASFEAVAGQRAAAVYTRMASRTISRHFRSVRDGVAAQVRAVRGALGEKDAGAAVPGMTKGETPRLRALDQCLRQHKAYQSGMLESHPWRPQRGLPERAVSVLRAWLFEHFLHPYPSDVDKHILARQTGLSRSQVSNWFINARVRLWKPMVEEMYAEEMKDKEEGSGGDGGGQSAQQAGDLANHNPADGSYASEGRGEQKPTRAQLHQLHDAGSLASVVSIGQSTDPQGLNFGMMDQLDFDAYEAATAGFGNGVSLTLGLQHQQQQHHHHHGGVNVAAFAAASPSSSSAAHGGAAEFLFMAGEGVHPSANGQFGAGMGSGADVASQYHRGLGGFHLLRDLAG